MLSRFCRNLYSWFKWKWISVWWDGFDEGERQGYRMGYRAGQDSLLPSHEFRSSIPYTVHNGVEGSDDDLPVHNEIGGM